MAGTTVRTQFIWHGVSGIPEDVYVNTFHFFVDAAVDMALATAAMTTRLTAFYQGPTTQITDFISDGVVSNATIRYYDLADPEPRVPVAVDTVGFSRSAAAAMPSEVALCASFRTVIVSGDVPQKMKNRVFIGPLAANALNDVANTPGKPATGLVTAMIDAMTALAADSGDTVDGVTAGVVWTLNPSTYAPITASRDVVAGWVDNAFDTQRRRGETATSRTLWP